MRNTALAILFAIVAVALVANIAFAIGHVSNGVALTYWDIAMLTGVPAGYVCGTVVMVRRFGLRPSSFMPGIMFGLVGSMCGAILSGVFMFTPFAAAIACIAMGVMAALAYGSQGS